MLEARVHAEDGSPGMVLRYRPMRLLRHVRRMSASDSAMSGTDRANGATPSAVLTTHMVLHVVQY
eukprot:1444249-Rhodomonas_salina.3